MWSTSRRASDSSISTPASGCSRSRWPARARAASRSRAIAGSGRDLATNAAAWRDRLRVDRASSVEASCARRSIRRLMSSSSIRRAPGCHAEALRRRRRPGARRASSTCRAIRRRSRGTRRGWCEQATRSTSMRRVRSVSEHAARRDVVRRCFSALARDVVAAAATSPSKSVENWPVRQKFSGCHCTPTQKRAPGLFDGFDDAVRRGGRDDEAGRGVLHRLVMPAVDGDAAVGVERRPSSTARHVSRRHAHVVRDRVLRLRDLMARGRSACWLGMSWTSVPPAATLSTCAPRQIASSGRSRASASRASASSYVVALGVESRRVGWRSASP